MIRIFIVLIICISCSGKQKSLEKAGHKVSSLKINEVLEEKGFSFQDTSLHVEVYSIGKGLIPGATNEYYNKLVKVKDLKKEEIQILKNSLLNDENYNWDFNGKSRDYTIQLDFKSASSNLTLLYDENTKTLALADLNGLILLSVKDNLHNQIVSYVSKLN